MSHNFREEQTLPTEDDDVSVEKPASEPRDYYGYKQYQKASPAARKAERKRLTINHRGPIKHLHAMLGLGTYIIFDIETTGGNPDRNGITEIMGIKVENGVQVDRFYSLVDPKCRVPPIVRKMTGISNEMLRGQPDIFEVMPLFMEFVGNHVLVSHNTIGDMKFLRYYSHKVTGQMMDNYYLCTHLLTEKLLPSSPDKSLTGLSRDLGLDTTGDAHRAEADAYLTWELFKILLGRMKEERIESIVDGIRYQGDFESAIRLGWPIKAAEVQSLPQNPGVLYLHNRHKRITFVLGVGNLNKEAAELAKISNLPRPLIKVVQQAKRLTFDTMPTSFAALLGEARFLSENTVDFDPAEWHQRVAQFVYLHKHKNGFDLGFGPLKPGTVLAYGPIRNGRLMSDFFQEIADVLGIKAKRRAIHLSHSQGELVRSLLLGLNHLVAPKFWHVITRYFDDTFRKHQRDAADLYQSLKQLEVPAELTSLDRLTGVLALRNDHLWQLYSIIGGVPEFVSQFHVAQVPFEPKSIQTSSQGLKKKLSRQQRLVFRRPFTPWQAHAANRVFWWLSQKQKDSIFLRLEDL